MLATTIRTDALPVHQRLRFLRTSMRALSFDCRIEPTGDEPINTRMIAHIADDFRLVNVAFTAHRTEHAAPVRRGADTFLVSLHQQGEIVVEQNGRIARIGPQDLFFIDTTRPFTIDAGPMRCLSLYLPGAQLRSVLPDVDRFTATAIPANPGSGALFGSMLEQIYRNIGKMDDVGARRVAAALPHLLGAALASRESGVTLARPTGDFAQRDQIRAFALEHLRDHELSCERISHAVSLSTRRIHELFERQPQTLMKWIWQERLERCRVDLSTRSGAHRTIAAVAFAWGFSDAAHFSRAFRAAFGFSPRAYRQLGASPGCHR
jgi:AraC family transcriptional activator of tynA and feaB